MSKILNQSTTQIRTWV